MKFPGKRKSKHYFPVNARDPLLQQFQPENETSAAWVVGIDQTLVDIEVMQLAHLECAKWLILTIPNGYEAGEIVASARAKNPDIEIIARAHYDDEVAYITERGANQVVMGEREIARTMLELLETPPAGEVVTG